MRHRGQAAYLGSPALPEGVSEHGQSVRSDELDRHYAIDTNTIVDAALLAPSWGSLRKELFGALAVRGRQRILV